MIFIRHVRRYGIIGGTSNLIVGLEPSFSGDKSENEASTWMNLTRSCEQKDVNIPCVLVER